MISRRLPAEWEDQDGVLVSWPHENSDWQPDIETVAPVFAEIIANISRFERVAVALPQKGVAQRYIEAAGADMGKVAFLELPTNDTWARDFGPITVIENGLPLLLDFGFNGWGLKFPADQDNRINSRAAAAGLFRAPLKTAGMILEGGSIESDGKGTLLTTKECLLGPNRNPHMSKRQIEQALAAEFGTDHILWLGNGYLAGDDTDSHIDTLARLCPDDTILYVSCDDPHDEHYPALEAMRTELESMRTKSGSPFRLIPLPWPSPCFGPEGERLPATYANFLVINGAVLVPTYNDQWDAKALEAVQKAFPARTIIGIDCRPLIIQHGSLHCLTMQLPKGTMS